MTAGESLDDEYDELKARRVHHDRNIKQLELKTLEVVGARLTVGPKWTPLLPLEAKL